MGRHRPGIESCPPKRYCQGLTPSTCEHAYLEMGSFRCDRAKVGVCGTWVSCVLMRRRYDGPDPVESTGRRQAEVSGASASPGQPRPSRGARVGHSADAPRTCRGNNRASTRIPGAQAPGRARSSPTLAELRHRGLRQPMCRRARGRGVRGTRPLSGQSVSAALVGVAPQGRADPWWAWCLCPAASALPCGSPPPGLAYRPQAARWVAPSRHSHCPPAQVLAGPPSGKERVAALGPQSRADPSQGLPRARPSFSLCVSLLINSEPWEAPHLFS